MLMIVVLHKLSVVCIQFSGIIFVSYEKVNSVFCSATALTLALCGQSGNPGALRSQLKVWVGCFDRKRFNYFTTMTRILHSTCENLWRYNADGAAIKVG